MDTLLPVEKDFRLRTQQQALEGATREEAIEMAQILLRTYYIQTEMILDLMRKGL